MGSMNNGKKILSELELLFAYPSIIIGVSILSLPSDVAKVTAFSDGWVSILIAGVISTTLAILALRIALHFPDQSFIDYGSDLVTKPIAILIGLIYIALNIIICAYVTRSVAYIAQQFLFERTPMAVLALSFLLVVVYAVAGSRVGVFRLNILFLPIILFVFLFVGIFNIPWVESANFMPLFETNMDGYLKGVIRTIPAYIGFNIAFFYIFLIKRKNNLMKQALIGMGISVVFYLFIFLITIGVFGNLVTGNLMFPTLDLAKRVNLPGAIFERIDAIVYTIWTMAIFNTTALFLDMAVILLTSIFKNAKKQIIVFILSPIILFISLFPREANQMEKIVSFGTKVSFVLTCIVVLLFSSLIVIKRRKKDGQT